MGYNEAVDTIYRPGTPPGPQDEAPTTPSRMKEIVRYATLAPSSHNTQCWKFRAEGEKSITILPDLERQCPVVDPDDHHMYVSLGCAVENLVIAAQAYGLEATKVDAKTPETGIHVEFQECPAVQMPRFKAIPHRHVKRTEYNGESLSQSELDQLLQAAHNENSGVHMILLTDEDCLKKACKHIQRANTAQVEDKYFREELESWIRFGEKECVTSGDGLATVATGHPFIPRWIGKYAFRFSFRTAPENNKIARQIQSSAGIAVFFSEKDDAAHWVEAGRVYQRFALEATNMGVHTAMLNQPVEVAEERPKFAAAFDIKGRPDLVVRFGKGGPDLLPSLRRPVEEVFEEL